MTIGTSYSGLVSSYADEDWYKVTLPSAGKFTLSFGHTYKKDYGSWTVGLYAADKSTRLHQASWSNRSTGTDSFTMGLKAGTYYVKVDYSLGGIVGETYTLKADFAASPFWEEEVNDDADAAKAMVIGSAYSGIIDAGGDEDWYKVTLPSAGKFTLSFGHTYKKDYGSWTVGLYAADKSTRLHQASWSNRSTGTDSFTMGLKAGTYYVKVDYSLGGIVGETYTLKADFAASPFWEEEVNDDADAAKAMVIGSAYSGIIDAGGDEDWYKVTLPSAGKFTLSFGHTYKKDYGSWTVGLYAADKSTRLHQASWSNRSTGTDSFTMGLKAGTYYVKVDYSLGGIVGETYTLRWDRALTKASISVSKSSLAYTGKAQKPSLTIKAGGVKLKKGTDYSVGYKNNKKVGIATITIKGKGSYAGVTRTTTFKIVPKGTTISKAAGGKKGFTVKWKKQASQTSGYQIRYSTAKSMKNAKTVTVTSTKKTSCKVTKLKAKKTYYIQVRTYKKVGKATYYSSWSKAKAVKTKK